MGFFKKLFNPIIFQGNLKKFNGYFEGWYYKLISRDGKHGLALIPGVALSKEKENTHAFIQVFDGIKENYNYLRYKVDEFCPSEEILEIKIGKSIFKENELKIDIDTEEIVIKGIVNLNNSISYPKSFFSPNIMSWFTFLPSMQAKHGVVTINAELEGKFEINGEEMVFDGGKGYIEKDYGKGFPNAYVWMQSNHFENNNVSIMISIASIPLYGINFIGFLGFFWYNNKVYRFGTYTRAKIRRFATTDKDKVELEISSKKWKLLVSAIKIGGVSLKSPTLGNMTSKINESLKSEIYVQFFEKTNKEFKLVFEDTGKFAGLEIEDNNNLILNKIGKK